MKTQSELIKEIQDRASEDDDFREMLLQDPAAALKEAVGIEVPSTINVHVHEDTANDRHIVLPTGEKMSEAELEIIAGSDGSGVWG